jgi:hypothetical protein
LFRTLAKRDLDSRIDGLLVLRNNDIVCAADSEDGKAPRHRFNPVECQ